MSPILPGATIGILGGGQLARMTAMAARQLGYRVHCLDPDVDCPTRPVVDRFVCAPFEDAAAAADLAAGCDVVTLDIERIPPASMHAAAARAPVRPGPEVLAVVQDRAVQKRWLASHGFPLARFDEVRVGAALGPAVRALGPRTFVKACAGGYDGRAQVRLDDAAAATVDRAWTELGGVPVVVEEAISLDAELSVLVARSPRGETAVYPPAMNHHEQQILAWSVLPAPVAPALAASAGALAERIAVALDVVGLLVVELFVDSAGRLLVNELAPRPHNSYHASEIACATSQFEQCVRAICDLPLGSTAVVRPAAIMNLLGDLWARGTPPLDTPLALRDVQVRLYGKRTARPGRKLGHLLAAGDTAEDAVARVQVAHALLEPQV